MTFAELETAPNTTCSSIIYDVSFLKKKQQQQQYQNRSNDCKSLRTCSLRDLMKQHFGKEDCLGNMICSDDDDSRRTTSTHSSSGSCSIGTSASSSMHSGTTQDELLSSTVTVHKGTGCVRFAPECHTVVGTVPNVADISPEERWNTWWCPQEYQAMRLGAKYATRQVQKSHPAIADAIRDALTNSIALAENKQITQDQHYFMLQDPVASLSASSAIMAHLDSWTCIHVPCRGLEKYVVPTPIKTLRTNYMAQARRTAVQLHQQQHGMISDEDIAEAYVEQSRYAHLFARCVGAADHKAANQVYQEGSSESGRSSRRKSCCSSGVARTESGDMSLCSIDSNDSCLLASSDPAASRSSLTRHTFSQTSVVNAAASLLLLDQAVSPSITTTSNSSNGSDSTNEVEAESRSRPVNSLEKTFSDRRLFRRQSSSRIQRDQHHTSSSDETTTSSLQLERSDSSKKLGSLKRSDSRRLLDGELQTGAVAPTKQRSSRRLSGDGGMVKSSSSRRLSEDGGLVKSSSSRRLSGDGVSSSTKRSSRRRSPSNDGTRPGSSSKDASSCSRTRVRRQGSSRRLSGDGSSSGKLSLSRRLSLGSSQFSAPGLSESHSYDTGARMATSDAGADGSSSSNRRQRGSSGIQRSASAKVLGQSLQLEE